MSRLSVNSAEETHVAKNADPEIVFLQLGMSMATKPTRAEWRLRACGSRPFKGGHSCE